MLVLKEHKQEKSPVLRTMAGKTAVGMGLYTLIAKCIQNHTFGNNCIQKYTLMDNCIQKYTFALGRTDAETQQRISGYVFVNNSKNGSYINSDYSPLIIKLREGRHIFRAENENYEQREIQINRLQSPVEICLRKKGADIELVPPPSPLPLVGWTVWKDSASDVMEITVNRGKRANECTVKSKGKIKAAAGFANGGLGNTLRGKTLILYFSNTEKQDFNEGRMVKLAYNKNDQLLHPVNAIFVHDEYLPAEDTPLDRGIEFPIPDNFDGKLNFVFYQAKLNNLKITAFYK